MNLSQDDARNILRLPLQGSLDIALIENAFQKQARRYPMEQFPEKFALVREAYAALTDSSLIIQDLLFNSSFDLSFLVESYEPLNPGAQTAAESFIFESLSAIMRENCREILEDTEDFDDDYADLSNFDVDEYMYDFLDDLVKRSLGKSAANRKKR